MYVHVRVSGEHKELNRDRGCYWVQGNWALLLKLSDSLQIKPHPAGLFETLSKRRLFNRVEKLSNARTAKEIVAAEERQKERRREMEKGGWRTSGVFNPPTVRESLLNLFIGLLLRGAPVRVQLVATTAEDAKTDLPESSLTKFA